jgi:hypothetical protein
MVRSLAVVGALVVSLAACAHPAAPGTQRTDSQLYSELGRIPGVSSVQFVGGSNGLPGNVEFGVQLSFAAGTLPELRPLVDYALAEIWSGTQTHPSVGVFLEIVEGGTRIDLTATAAELGLKNIGSRIFEVPEKQMVERYGSWPGKAPTLPVSIASPAP